MPVTFEGWVEKTMYGAIALIATCAIGWMIWLTQRNIAMSEYMRDARAEIVSMRKDLATISDNFATDAEIAAAVKTHSLYAADKPNIDRRFDQLFTMLDRRNDLDEKLAVKIDDMRLALAALRVRVEYEDFGKMRDRRRRTIQFPSDRPD